MAKRTHHPAQLAFDFDAPAAEVEKVDSTKIIPTFGMPVSLDCGPSFIAVTSPENGVIGHVLGHLVQPLGRMLSSVDVTIDATLGQIGDRSFEVIVVRTTDDGTFRNVVRCARTGADDHLRQAA